MNILQDTIQSYNKLLDKKYNIVLGYKNKQANLQILFNKSSFFHLAGLHKLTDLHFSSTNKAVMYDDILKNTISFDYISNSIYYEDIKNRLLDLKNLEFYIDNSDNFFDWNKKIAVKGNINSHINANYLAKSPTLFIENCNSYIFLKAVGVNKNNHKVTLIPTLIDKTIPTSFFPSSKDYATMQKRYTLLYKEKFIGNESEILYKHHNYTPPNKTSEIALPKIVNLDGAEILNLTKFSQDEQAKEKNNSDNNKLEERMQRTQNETNEISFIPNLLKAQTKNNSSNKGISSSEKRSLNDFKFPKKQQSESTVQNRENQPQNRNNYNDFSR